MKFQSPLISGKLIERYKRFMADVELEDGDVITAHCANPGSMMGLKEPGSTVWLSESDNPKRKLQFSWELVRVHDHLVGINTALPNKIVEEAVRAGKIEALHGYRNIRREVKYGQSSRIDLLLDNGDDAPMCYVEVKNVTLSRERGLAEFPDSVTARGAKHLLELSDMVADGHRAVMLYLVQRQDCERFAIAGDIDPAYLEAFQEAREAGVEALCYSCFLTTEDISVDRPLPISAD